MNDTEGYRTLLGRQVVVVMKYEDETCKEIAHGKLLGFGQGGDFEVLDEMGMIHYCWPALEMHEVK